MNTNKRHCPRSMLLAAALLASLAAVSCDNSVGIYTNIQQEHAQSGTDAFKKTTSTNAFKLGSYYYATTAKLYRRSTASDATEWKIVSINGSESYYIRSAVLAGSTIYALTGIDSSSVALYAGVDDGSGNLSWTGIAMPGAPADHSITNSYSNFALDALYSANGELYAEGNYYVSSGYGVGGTSYYYLYRLSGSALSPVSSLSAFINTTSPIRDVVYGGSTYYFASTGALYSDSAADGSTASSIIDNFTNLSSKKIWALSYTGSHLYVSTTTGYLYRDSGDGYQIYSVSRPLTKVIEVPYSSGNILLVGTDTNDVDVAAIGYYEGTWGSASSFVLGSTNHIVASSSAVYSTTVSAFPVHQFYYDSTLGNLFVCISPGTTSSSYYGLYETSWNGTSWSGWDAQ